MCEKLFVGRHGFSNSDGSLMPEGRTQMEQVAAVLSGLILKGDVTPSIALLSSTAPRAVTSASIIGAALGVTAEASEVLWSDIWHPMRIDPALKFVQRFLDADIVVVVTHTGYADCLPMALAKLCWNQYYSPLILSPGEVSLLDFEAKTYTMVPTD